MLVALSVAFVAGIVTGLGALPFLFRGRVPRKAYDLVLGVGAGLMTAAATLGLLGAAVEGVREGGELHLARLAQILGGFVLGVAVMMLMDHLIPHHHASGHLDHIGPTPEEKPSPTQPHVHAHGHGEVRQGLLISGAMTIHRIPEGFAIGAGFGVGAGHDLGWLLAIAVGFQNMCEGAIIAAPLRQGGTSRLGTLGITLVTGLVTPLAAVGGWFVGTELDHALPFALSLAAGALIYLIYNEIIPETHSHGNERHATFGVVLGFLIVLLVTAAGHSH